MTFLSIEHIIQDILKEHSGVCENKNWGERGLFYNPCGKLPKGIYILTFKEKDGANDKASSLDRGNLYRLNLGVSKPTYKSFFGAQPKRPAAGKSVATGHDFAKINTIMPHPIYAWMSWIAVLNPSLETYRTLKPFIAEAIELAKKKYEQKIRTLKKGS